MPQGRCGDDFYANTLACLQVEHQGQRLPASQGNTTPSGAMVHPTHASPAMSNSNPHSDQQKEHTPDKVLNDEQALRKHRDKPDDPEESPVDPEHDYPDPSGQRD